MSLSPWSYFSGLWGQKAHGRAGREGPSGPKGGKLELWGLFYSPPNAQGLHTTSCQYPLHTKFYFPKPIQAIHHDFLLGRVSRGCVRKETVAFNALFFFLLPDPGLIYISPVWSFQIHLQDLLDVTLAFEDRSMQSDPKWCPLFPPLILSKWHLLDFTNNLNNVHFKYWFLTLTNYALNMCFTAQRYLHLTTNQKACLFLHRQQTGIENVW